MLNVNKIKKVAKNIYREILKYILPFLVVISLLDLYFYIQIWDNKTSNLLVGIRIFVALVIIVVGIYAVFNLFWTCYRLRNVNRKEVVDIFDFDFESVFDIPVKKECPKPIKKIDPTIQDFALHIQAKDKDVKKLVSSKLLDYLQSREPYPPVDDVINCGMFPILAKDLMSKDTDIQVTAACIIACIAKYKRSFIPEIVRAGVIPSFIELLKSDKPVTDDLMCVQNVAVFGFLQFCQAKTYRDLCVQQGIIAPLMKYIDLINLNKMLPNDHAKNVSALFLLLCCPYNDDESSLENARLLLPELKKLSKNTSDGLIFNVIKMIRNFLKAGPKYVEVIIDFEVFEFVIDNFQNVSKKFHVDVYDISMDFIADKSERIQHLIDCGILPVTIKLFPISNAQVKKLMLSLLSKIVAAGEESYIDDMIEAEVVQFFISLQNDKNVDLKIQQNALENLSNIIKFANFDHALIMFDENFIHTICNILDHENFELKEMAMLCIKGLLELLSEFSEDACQTIVDCGGLDKIMQLQMSPKTGKAANEVIASFLHAKKISNFE